jgi:hypothetical protein
MYRYARQKILPTTRAPPTKQEAARVLGLQIKFLIAGTDREL